MLFGPLNQQIATSLFKREKHQSIPIATSTQLISIPKCNRKGCRKHQGRFAVSDFLFSGNSLIYHFRNFNFCLNFWVPWSLRKMSEETFSGPVVNVYPLTNYSFGTKEPKIEKDTDVSDRLERMKANYMREGMRTCVEGILLVQEYNHPHLLLLQVANAFFKLPGGCLKPGENEIEGLKCKLTSKLAPNSSDFQPNWQTGECIGVWWRPNFESLMYPYCLPHVSKPKECKKLFLVHLSEKEYFAIPKNLKLLAVPLFELFDNVQRYGSIIASIPQQLSRFSFNLIS